MSPASLVERVKAILIQPQATWAVIDGESTTTQALYTGYVIPLAAIAAIARLIGLTVFGFPVGRSWLTYALPGIAIAFVFDLVGVYVLALIIDALAPNFGGQKNLMQALKVSAYCRTPVWVAGLLSIVPVLRSIAALVGGLYALYLLYLGLPVLMKSPAEKSIGYVVVTIIAVIVLYVLVGAIIAALGMSYYSAWSYT